MKSTRIVFVLDESGSMNGREDFVTSSFKEEAMTIKEAKCAGKVTTSLVRFGSTPPTKKGEQGSRPGDQWQPYVAFENRASSALSLRDYKPEGDTPLRDAVALGIRTAQRGAKTNTAFLVSVFTDGYENASREWSDEALGSLIREKQSTGRWTFNFIGPANCDKLTPWGVPRGNVHCYTSVDAGLQVMTSATSVYLNLVRPASMSTCYLATTAVQFVPVPSMRS